jgi:hypothetical protein
MILRPPSARRTAPPGPRGRAALLLAALTLAGGCGPSRVANRVGPDDGGAPDGGALPAPRPDAPAVDAPAGLDPGAAPDGQATSADAGPPPLDLSAPPDLARGPDVGGVDAPPAPRDLGARDACATCGKALLVTGVGAPAADNPIEARLRALGLEVTRRGHDVATAADGAGAKVIVISETTTSAAVGDKFKPAAAPVVVLEPWLFDDMGMTGAGEGTDYGLEMMATQIALVAGGPLAAGLSGTVTVASAASPIGWGVSPAGAMKIATVVGQTARATIFAYEKGAALAAGTAAGRRVGFFLHSGGTAALSANGGKLFDAAVTWAAEGAP